MLAGVHAPQWALCLCPCGVGAVCIPGELTKLLLGPFPSFCQQAQPAPLAPLDLTLSGVRAT